MAGVGGSARRGGLPSAAGQLRLHRVARGAVTAGQAELAAQPGRRLDAPRRAAAGPGCVAASRSDRLSRRVRGEPGLRLLELRAQPAYVRLGGRVAASAAAASLVAGSERGVALASRRRAAHRRASPSRWRSTLWSACAAGPAPPGGRAREPPPAPPAGTPPARRAARPRPRPGRPGHAGRRATGDRVRDDRPPIRRRGPATRARPRSTGSPARRGERRDLDRRVAAELVVGQGVPDQAAAEPGAARRREAGHLAQLRRHGGDRGQHGGHEGHHPQAEPLGQGGRVVTSRPSPGGRVAGGVGGRPRSTTSIASARPHQRHDTDSTDSASTVSSSTRWSPARSKCQYSVVRRVRVTSKRVRLPQPAQRQRSPSPGTRRSAVWSATGAPWFGGHVGRRSTVGAASVVRAPSAPLSDPTSSVVDMSTTAHRPPGRPPAGRPNAASTSWGGRCATSPSAWSTSRRPAARRAAGR